MGRGEKRFGLEGFPKKMGGALKGVYGVSQKTLPKKRPTMVLGGFVFGLLGAPSM